MRQFENFVLIKIVNVPPHYAEMFVFYYMSIMGDF
jgi:hypothetical protein